MEKELKKYLKDEGYSFHNDEDEETAFKPLCTGYGLEIVFGKEEKEYLALLLSKYEEESIDDVETSFSSDVQDFVNKYLVLESAVIGGLTLEYPKNFRYNLVESMEESVRHLRENGLDDKQIIEHLTFSA